MTSDLLLQADDVRLEFSGQVALDSVHLDLKEGEFISLIGASGCGKTSLLRLLAGLIEPTAGRLTRPGLDRADHSPSLAYVFQEPILLDWRTVYENVRLPLELSGVSPGEQDERIRETLQLVALAEHAQKYPRQLSGGMRMRVSLARALITRPRLLLFDEPFAALDDLLRQQLNEEILRLWKHEGWAAVFVTHNIAEAVFLSQRVIVLGSRPSTIVRDLTIDLPYPRDRTLRADPRFVQFSEEVFALLRSAGS